MSVSLFSSQSKMWLRVLGAHGCCCIPRCPHGAPVSASCTGSAAADQTLCWAPLPTPETRHHALPCRRHNLNAMQSNREMASSAETQSRCPPSTAAQRGIVVSLCTHRFMATNTDSLSAVSQAQLPVPCKPLTNAHLPVHCPLGLGCPSARASGYGSVIDHRPDVKLGFSPPPFSQSHGQGAHPRQLHRQAALPHILQRPGVAHPPPLLTSSAPASSSCHPATRCSSRSRSRGSNSRGSSSNSRGSHK